MEKRLMKDNYTANRPLHETVIIKKGGYNPPRQITPPPPPAPQNPHTAKPTQEKPAR